MPVTTELEHSRMTSPRTIARLIGVGSLLTVIGGAYAQGYVSRRLIVWHDAATTAANFLAHRNLVLSGLAAYLVEMACGVATAALFYVLLKPAGRTLALTALCLELVAGCIKTMARVFFVAPLFVLGGHFVHGLSPQAYNDVALILLLVNDRAAGIAMVFFGFRALVGGVLILRSSFLPRFLGVLMMVGGAGWLANLWPPLWGLVGDYVLYFALVAVAVTIFWLLVFGVNEKRWYEQAGWSKW